MNGISKCYLFKNTDVAWVLPSQNDKKRSLEKAAFGSVLGALVFVCFFFNIKQTIFMKNTYLLNTCETLEYKNE